MNNNERNLSPDEEKKLELLTREKERQEDLVKELSDKLSKIQGGNYQGKKEELERVIKDLDEKIKAAKESNKRLEEEIFQATQLGHTSSDDPYDLCKVNFPGGDIQVVHFYQLSNFNNQVLTYFSYLDCPFKDEGAGGHSKAQKLELMRSITGLANPPTTPDNVITNNEANTDKEWEYKEPNKVSGIIEPTVGSYEWCRRWWKFHQRFRQNVISYGKRNDYEAKNDDGSYKYPVLLAVKSSTAGKENTSEYRDVLGFIAQNDHSIVRANSYLFDNPILLNFWEANSTSLNRPGFTKPNFPLYSRDSFDNDFLYFFTYLFNRGNLTNNLLLNDKASTKYLVGPDDWRTNKKYNGLNFNRWVLINGKPDDLDPVNYNVEGVEHGEAVSQNYIKLSSSNPPYRITSIANGLVGLASTVDTIYNSGATVLGGVNVPNLKDEYIRRYGFVLISNPNLKVATSNVMSRNKLCWYGGDILGVSNFQDTIEDEKELARKRKELRELDPGHYEGKEKELEEEIRSRNQKINELRRQIETLTGNSEKKLRDQLLRQARRVKDFIDGKKRQTPEWFKTFNDEVDKLNKVVRERLKDEPQNKNNKKLEDGSKEYDEFNIKLADKSDQYFGDDETKQALTKTDGYGIRDAWKLYNDEIWTKINEPMARLSTLFVSNKLTREKKQFENWLKDKNNARAAGEMLKEYDKLKAVVVLDEFDEWAADKIRDSEIFSKNLEATLREILGSRYRPRFSEAWRKMGYGEGNAFHELITYKTDLRNDKFKTWLNAKDKGGPGYSGTFASWLEEKSRSDDPKRDILAYILRYRLNEYIEEGSEGRKGYKKEIVLDWINKTREINEFTFEDFSDMTGGDGKKGNEILRNFVRSFARPYGDVMDLDPGKSSENRIIEKWMNAGYKVETVKNLKEGMDEEFMKDKDPKGVWDTDPKKLHKEVREHQINKEGVTKENYKELKEKDKEKLEKVIGYLNDLIEHKLATEEQIEFHKQLSSHIASLTTTGGDKPEGETGGDKPEGETGGDKPEGETGGDKPEGETGGDKTPTEKEPEKVPLWKKGGYAIFWAPILALFLIGGLGYALGWWGGKKEEADEEATTETEEGEK